MTQKTAILSVVRAVAAGVVVLSAKLAILVPLAGSSYISPEVPSGSALHRSPKSVQPQAKPPVQLQYSVDAQVVGVRQGQIYYDPSSGQVAAIQQGPVTYSPSTGQVKGYYFPGAFVPIQ